MLRRALLISLLLTALASLGWCQTVAPLVQSTAPVSVGLRLQGGVYQADLEVKEACTVVLFCPTKPGLVSFAGLNQRAEMSYDQKARTLSMSLAPGKYLIVIRSL